jgi:DNA N-6-adenine-methyltransferase (Dam)
MNSTSQRNYNSSVYNRFEKNIADDYETPEWLFNYIKKRFNITVDISGDSTSSKVKGSPLYDKGFNALDADWSRFPGTKYCFPPFSKPFFGQFLSKSHYEWTQGESTIVVAPLKTLSVDYFQAVKAPIIHIIYPRVNFIYNGREIGAPDSICLLEYNASIEAFVSPKIEFLDLKSIIPISQKR